MPVNKESFLQLIALAKAQCFSTHDGGGFIVVGPSIARSPSYRETFVSQRAAQCALAQLRIRHIAAGLGVKMPTMPISLTIDADSSKVYELAFARELK